MFRLAKQGPPNASLPFSRCTLKGTRDTRLKRTTPMPLGRPCKLRVRYSAGAARLRALGRRAPRGTGGSTRARRRAASPP
eukprot:9184607-Pyramimonas_sp.AAC.1